MSGPHITFTYEPFSMPLKDGNGLVLKEQFIDKSGKNKNVICILGFKKFQNNVKRNVKRTSLFTIITRTNAILYVCQLNKIKIKMKIYVDH